MNRSILSAVLSATLGGAIVAVAMLALPGGSSRSGKTVSSAAASQTTTGTHRNISTGTLTAAQVYARDSAGVVAIKARSASSEDNGTGIVLNEEGLILTNDHVIAGASSITVSPGKSTGQTRVAKVVGEEANSDIALIQIDPAGLGLTPLKLVSSSTVEVGETVYAIGNPYNLDETLTRGIVSALGRKIQAPNGTAIEGAIQTDAALNPGNSGGPLINDEGNVVGINSQIASDQSSATGSQPGNTGVGFAISSNTAEQAIKRIEAGETVAGRSETASTLEASGEGSSGGNPYGYGYREGAGGAAEAGPEVLVVP